MDTMTENDYLTAWGLYAFAALGCLLVWWRMTRWIWRWLREPLLLLMAVLLFSPTIVDPVKTQFAPAVAITALDLVLKVGNNAWRAVSDLALVLLAVPSLLAGAYAGVQSIDPAIASAARAEPSASMPASCSSER